MNPTDVPLAVLAAALAVTLVRLARGPSLGDRVVAAELGSAVLVAALPLLAVRLGSTAVLDVAIVAALLQFVATAALAWLLQHQSELDDEERA